MRTPISSPGPNNPVRSQIESLIQNIGRAALNAQYPNDFEYYICSFELVDSQNRTIDFFVFPVMPQSISQAESKIVNIKKTAGGITTLNTTTFEPIDINISGNFGRRLKILIGRQEIDFAGIKYSIQSGNYGKNQNGKGVQIKEPVFSNTIKSGYGCIKILQAIYRKANAVDDTGNPFKLYFYNPAVGDNFLVKPINLNLSQNSQENMIWNYNMTLRAIAPASSTDRSDSSSIGQTLGASVLGKAANLLARNLKDSIINKITPQLVV